MTKLNLSARTLAVISLLSTYCLTGHGQPIDGPFPSMNHLETNRFSSAASDLIYETSDLRLLHCDIDTLNRRFERSVCIFDMAGLALGSGSELARSCEVKLKKPTTLKKVLLAVGMGKWNGGQPQIKVVTKNSIVQSSLTSPSVKQSDLEKFLKINVSPGDFIVLTKAQ